MLPNELYDLVLGQVKTPKIHPLHHKILKECCDSALANPISSQDSQSLFNTVAINFIIQHAMLKETLSGCVNHFNADQVTLNYGGEVFILPKSFFLN